MPYEGSLRDDLFEWMHEWQERNDLCLALGTSLSGFNVDQVGIDLFPPADNYDEDPDHHIFGCVLDNFWINTYAVEVFKQQTMCSFCGLDRCT